LLNDDDDDDIELSPDRILTLPPTRDAPDPANNEIDPDSPDILSPVAIEIEPDDPPPIEDPLRIEIDPDPSDTDEAMEVSIDTPDIPIIDIIDPIPPLLASLPSDTPVEINMEPPCPRPLPPSIEIDPP